MNTTKTARTLAAASLAVATGIASADTPALSTASYVQNGLIACWDGVENAGQGVRITSPTVWKDVVGGREFVLTDVTVDADRMTFAGKATSYGTLSADDTTATFVAAKDGTVEIVYASRTGTGNQCFFQGPGTSGMCLWSYLKDGSYYLVTSSSYANYDAYDFSSGTATNSVAVRYASAKPASALANGSPLESTLKTFLPATGSTTTIGTRSAKTGYHFPGSIYTIRLYGRPLTDAEIAANRAVDEERFIRGNASARRGITFAGFPALQGESNPGYGTHAFEPGETYTFSAPAVWTNEAATAAATCRGFTLALADGRTVTSSALSTNITYSAELDDAVLTWQWEMHKSITVANFDYDLATVYVNGLPHAHGEKYFFMPGESKATVELRDFRSDWYFAYAPASQTDRTLAFESWEGLPAGADATANPVTITADAELTITPNIDCKGHVWYAEDADASISNATYKMSASSWNAANRSLNAGAYKAYYAGDRMIDFAMRVRKDGVNYTVTSMSGGLFTGSAVTTVRVPPRLSSWGFGLTSGAGGATAAGQLTTFIGLQETAVTTVEGNAFYYAPVVGEMTNYVPHGTTVIGNPTRGGNCYYNKSGLTGPLVLPHVEIIYGSSFYGCTGITELYSESPNLTTIAGSAFTGTSKMKKVTLASPVLSSVAGNAFSVALTNFTYLSAPPASQEPLDAIVAPVSAADGDHTLALYVPLCTPGWWDLVSEPTAAEVAAGLPEGCYGVYVTVTGDRKGWMIATDDVGASLVVTDMSKAGNTGYEIHTGLAAGDEIPLSSEGFTACDLQHFNRATGAWETFETKTGSSFTYIHDGRLTRARWKVNGHALNLSSDCYGGTFAVSGAQPIYGDNIYAPNAVLTVTAVGRAEHPTSHFAKWTSGVAGSATNSAAITVTMDSDKVLAAAFYPDEWLYDATAKTITDGEYTSSGTLTLDSAAKSFAIPNFTGGMNYTLWLDLSLPVYVPEDPTGEYAVTSFGIAWNSTFRKIRFGPRFAAFTGNCPFASSRVIERLDNLGHTVLTAFPANFTHSEPKYSPLHLSTTYEANDFLPETLVEVGDLWYTGGPYLVGTLNLPNFTTYGVNGDSSFSTRTTGVTNLYLTCKALTSFPYKLFHGMNLQELTIGSTNLAAAVSGAFSGAANTLERLNFLAHAPAAAALDNILVSYSSRTTSSANPLQIHCSKHAPGWRALKAEVDKTSAEWLSRPQGTWGIYQTAAGKRFYLVQRDSVHDENLRMMIILR